MPVVGFHQARRHKQPAAERLRRELAWPRPWGILASLAGAALVFNGALALTPFPSAVAPASSPAASTPAVSSLAASPTAAPSPEPAPAVPLEGIAESGAPVAPLIGGAAADAPIQELFAAGNVSPAEPGLRQIANPSSTLVLVNKRNPLVPAGYEPPDLVSAQVLSGSTDPVLLRAEAAAAAEQLFAAAASQGVHVTAKSSFRSYSTQTALYNGYVADKGVAGADSTSARPGYSEHQTGLALDIGDADAGTACDFASCFENSAAAQWVAAHGADFGFLVRYVPGQEEVTGYLAEPWHLRYVGVAVASDMRSRGILSFEEYLGLPPAPGYH